MNGIRERIYQGEIVHLPTSASSLELVKKITALLEKQFGHDFKTTHTRLSNDEFLSQLSLVRSKINTDQIKLLAWAILKEAEFDVHQYLIDQVRLRAIIPNAHTISAARAVYIAHRDTWYGNSQSQINCWIPLHEVKTDAGFDIYPNYFTTAVKNNSAQFDYQSFKESVGWQSSKADRDLFPSLLGEFDEQRAVPIYGDKASHHLFSASHLHRTKKIAGDDVRFSLDFRFVHIDDHQKGRGAPNVDNQSTGSATDDYTAY